MSKLNPELKARYLSERARLAFLNQQYSLADELYSQAWRLMPEHSIYRPPLALDYALLEYLHDGHDESRKLAQLAADHFNKRYGSLHTRVLFTDLVLNLEQMTKNRQVLKIQQITNALHQKTYPLPGHYREFLRLANL